MSVREPFGLAKARRYPLREIAQDAGAELIDDGLEQVDASARTVRSTSGAQLRYDALILGLGARIQAHEHATTIDDSHLDDLLRG